MSSCAFRLPDVLDDPALRGWLRLARCPGLDLATAFRLAGRGGAAAWSEGVPGDVADALPGELRAALSGSAAATRLEGELDRARAGGWTFLHLDHPGYPTILRGLTLPPPVLTVLGSPDALGGPGVAVVGTRRPTGYGLRMAGELATGLASVGLVIVSGLAKGVDAAAHRGALDGGGRTVAVMGTGAATVYPRDHAALARAIRDRGGALVTEFPPDAPPEKRHFPQRNRVIAGLADAVVVVEAARRSGSLITAGCALGLNRPVLAVPGRAGEPEAEGTLELLRDGAPLAATVADVLVELPPERSPIGPVAVRAAPEPDATPPGLDAVSARVLTALPQDDERHVDALLRELKLAADVVLPALFGLQLAGLVDALPGGWFRKARTLSNRDAAGCVGEPPV